MSTRRILAIGMVMLLTALPAAAAPPQSVIGSISGSIDARTAPTGSFVVRLRDAITGQVVKSMPLGAKGEFMFSDLPLGRRYLVELYDTASNKVVATQGPFLLSTATSLVRTGVTMSTFASHTPAALWLMAAGAGTASAIATATESASR
jgi:hypothetical protein